MALTSTGFRLRGASRSRVQYDSAVNGVLVFDLDNTIVHSRIDFAGIRRDLLILLRSAGVADPSDEELMRLSIGQIIELGANRRPHVGEQAWQIVLEYEREGMLASTVEACAAHTLLALRDHGFGLSVLTNNARPATLDALKKFDLSALFDLVLTRDEVPMKPDPTGLHRAREHFDGTAGRIAMIGDSWLDGTAAHQAGFPFVAFRPRPGVLAERGVPVWTVVERLDELPDLLAGEWPIP